MDVRYSPPYPSTGNAMTTLFRVTVAFCTLATPLLALAQPVPSTGTANMAVQITEARQKNVALMRTYSWNERADIMKNGKSVDLRIDVCTYLPDGQLQRTLMNDEHAPLPGGFFRKKAAESKIKDMEKYLKGLRSLLDQYTLPSAGAVLDFAHRADDWPRARGFPDHRRLERRHARRLAHHFDGGCHTPDGARLRQHPLPGRGRPNDGHLGDSYRADSTT